MKTIAQVLVCIVIALVPLFSVHSASIYALSKDIPAMNKYEDFEKLVRVIKDKSDRGNLFDVNAFEVLLKTNRDDAVLLLAKAYQKVWPEGNFSCPVPVKGSPAPDIINPVVLAYRFHKDKVIDGLLDIDPKLIDTGGQAGVFVGPTPLTEAVQKGDVVWVKTFISRGADVHVPTPYDTFPSNLLTISTSREVDQILIERQIETEGALGSPLPSRCLSDRVRLRKEPSTESDILAQLKTDEPVSILGYTFKKVTIGSDSGRWIQVNYKGKVGWVFQPYVEVFFQE